MKKIATHGILENIKEGKVSIHVYTFIYIETIEDSKEHAILF